MDEKRNDLDRQSGRGGVMNRSYLPLVDGTWSKLAAPQILRYFIHPVTDGLVRLGYLRYIKRHSSNT